MDRQDVKKKLLDESRGICTLRISALSSAGGDCKAFTASLGRFRGNIFCDVSTRFSIDGETRDASLQNACAIIVRLS
jgi:hypothetical protein